MFDDLQPYVLPATRKRPPLDPNKKWPRPPSAWDTIKCCCGWNSCIPTGASLLYIPNDIYCPQCGELVIAINKFTL